MSRVKIRFPKQKYLIEVPIPLRVTDMNYGNHLGNDKVLSLFHEARLSALEYLGFSELDIGSGVSLIMADVMIRYRSEGFYGDDTYIQVWIDDLTTSSFQVYYKLIAKEKDERVIAEGKTGLVCFDYKERVIKEVPEIFQKRLISKYESKS